MADQRIDRHLFAASGVISCRSKRRQRQGMNRLQDLWTLTVDVWNHGLLGTKVGDILIAIVIVVLAVFVRRLFSNIVVANLKRATTRTRNHFDDVAVDAIAPPLRLVPIIIGLYLAFRFLDPAPKYWVTLELVIRSMVAFTIFWAIHRAILPMSRAIRPLQNILGAATVDWVVKAVRLVIMFIGAAIILEMWGIKVGPLLAGLGLFGVAVALGAQDLFKNLIAGMAILTEKRFAKGETVSVDGLEGTVEAIGFRSTSIRRGDKAPVYLPNSKLADGAVANLSRFTSRQINWKISLDHHVTVARLRAVRQAIEDYIKSNEAFSKDGVTVRIDALTTSSIDMTVACFTATSDAGRWQLAKEELALRIKEIIEEEGAAFASPTQALTLTTDRKLTDEDDDLPARQPEPQRRNPAPN
jgi:MscS family membrane protein